MFSFLSLALSLADPSGQAALCSINDFKPIPCIIDYAEHESGEVAGISFQFDETTMVVFVGTPTAEGLNVEVVGLGEDLFEADGGRCIPINQNTLGCGAVVDQTTFKIIATLQ